MQVNPYLNFDGNASEAMDFYKSVFGGEFSHSQKMAEAPGMENLPEDEKNRVMHISLPLKGGIILMASDIIPSMGHTLSHGNSVQITLSPESREEADELFNGLSEGGEIEMEMQDTFWGAYFGSFKDKYGIPWMINFETQS